jgi:hypothetical protein
MPTGKGKFADATARLMLALPFVDVKPQNNYWFLLNELFQLNEPKHFNPPLKPSSSPPPSD